MTETVNYASRIMLIDDHPAVLTGLQMLLESRNYKIQAVANSMSEALSVLQEKKFDIVLLDLTLKDGSGFELLPEIEALGIAVLVYTMHEDPAIINKIFKYGAMGYVSKQEDTEILFDAISSVSCGKRFVSPCAKDKIKNDSADSSVDILSTREGQIFSFMGMGYGNTEIAEKLGLSRRTVETYCSRMVQKMDLQNRRELRKLAVSMA